MPTSPRSNLETNSLRLRPNDTREQTTTSRVQKTLEKVGIVLQPAHVNYIASVMFGEGLDDLHCGYCGHPGEHHAWTLGPQPDGSLDVNHFTCRDCANEKNTHLVVCYTRPNTGVTDDGY